MKSENAHKQQTQDVISFQRKKQVSRKVLITDWFADRIINIGGVLVILGVLGILEFLDRETFPLFQSGAMTKASSYTVEIPAEQVLALTMDEYKTLVFTLFANGASSLRHAVTGVKLTPPHLDFQEKTITAVANTIDQAHLAIDLRMVR
jgi:ABC-type uncharacterized transport system permease subunit